MIVCLLRATHFNMLVFKTLIFAIKIQNDCSSVLRLRARENHHGRMNIVHTITRIYYIKPISHCILDVTGVVQYGPICNVIKMVAPLRSPWLQFLRMLADKKNYIKRKIIQHRIGRSAPSSFCPTIREEECQIPQ